MLEFMDEKFEAKIAALDPDLQEQLGKVFGLATYMVCAHLFVQQLNSFISTFELLTDEDSPFITEVHKLSEAVKEFSNTVTAKAEGLEYESTEEVSGE